MFFPMVGFENPALGFFLFIHKFKKRRGKMRLVKTVFGFLHEYFGLYLFIVTILLIWLLQDVCNESISPCSVLRNGFVPLIISIWANILTSLKDRKKLNDNNDNLQGAYSKKDANIHGLNSEIIGITETLARKIEDEEIKKDFKRILIKAKNIQACVKPKGEI